MRRKASLMKPHELVWYNSQGCVLNEKNWPDDVVNATLVIYTSYNVAFCDETEFW